MLETEQEDVIYLARNGMIVAQMTLIQKSLKKRIGVTEGKFKVPEVSDECYKEVEEIFGVEI